MAHLFKKLVVVCGIFVAFSIAVLAQGREVTIYFKEGQRKSGELLSVRDSLVSFLKRSVEEDEEIAGHPEIVDIVLLKDIDKVVLHEIEVHGAAKGAGIGAVIGAAFGALATALFEDDAGRIIIGGLYGAAAGGSSGLVVGWVVGGVLSDDEETVRPSLNRGLKNIREYARFDEREPKYVRDIIDDLLKERQ